MTQELYELQNYNFEFFKKYSFLFENRKPPITSIGEYFTLCGYKPEEGPLLAGGANFGLFSLDILAKYQDSFLFHFPDTGKVGYTFVYNFGDDQHLWAYVVNFPDESQKEKPRFVVLPVFYSNSADRIQKFFHDNQEFLIKPATQTRRMGFGGMMEDYPVAKI